MDNGPRQGVLPHPGRRGHGLRAGMVTGGSNPPSAWESQEHNAEARPRWPGSDVSGAFLMEIPDPGTYSVTAFACNARGGVRAVLRTIWVSRQLLTSLKGAPLRGSPVGARLCAEGIRRPGSKKPSRPLFVAALEALSASAAARSVRGAAAGQLKLRPSVTYVPSVRSVLWVPSAPWVSWIPCWVSCRVGVPYRAPLWV